MLKLLQIKRLQFNLNLVCVNFVAKTPFCRVYLNSSLTTENIFSIFQKQSQYIFEHSVAFDQKCFLLYFTNATLCLILVSHTHIEFQNQKLEEKRKTFMKNRTFRVKDLPLFFLYFVKNYVHTRIYFIIIINILIVNMCFMFREFLVLVKKR